MFCIWNDTKITIIAYIFFPGFIVQLFTRLQQLLRQCNAMSSNAEMKWEISFYDVIPGIPPGVLFCRAKP